MDGRSGHDGQRGERAAVWFQVEQWGAAQAVEAADGDDIGLDADEADHRGGDGVGADRGAEGKCAAGGAVVFRALQREVPAGAVQPVDDLNVRVGFQALQSWHPRVENFDPADGAVQPALARGFQPGGPGRVDAADKDQAGIVGWRWFDGRFAWADFEVSCHGVLYSSLP